MASNNYTYNQILKSLNGQGASVRLPLQAMNRLQTEGSQASLPYSQKPTSSSVNPTIQTSSGRNDKFAASSQAFQAMLQGLNQTSSPPRPQGPSNQLPPSSPVVKLDQQCKFPLYNYSTNANSALPHRLINSSPTATPMPPSFPSSESAIHSEPTVTGKPCGSVDSPDTDPIKVKKETVETSLSLNKDEAGFKQQPLKAYHRLALTAYAASHAILPIHQSRKTWANKNKVSEDLVNSFLADIIRLNRKEKKGSKDKWRLPKEVVTKEKFEKKQISEHRSDPAEEMLTKSTEPTVSVKPIRDSPTEDAQTTTSNDTGKETVAPVQPFNALTKEIQSFPVAINGSLPTNGIQPGPTLAASLPPNPGSVAFPPELKAEAIELLMERNFFSLVTGPYAIVFEDMLNWPTFEFKLRLHGCSLQPHFVWRLLKTFYFFF